MVDKKPIYVIAKDLGLDSNQVLKACNHIGIYAKAASKRLEITEVEQIITYFKNGINVSNEVIDIQNEPLISTKNKKSKELTRESSEINYFPNRLIK